MTNQPSANLDHFEVLLLRELQSHIDQEDNTTSKPGVIGGSTRWQQNRRWQFAGVAAAAALAVAVIVPILAPTPAYAVTERNDGEIRVQVNRLEGAEELERALADHGVTADITYLPSSKECAPDRYAAVHTPGLTLSVSADTFEVTIPAGAVGKDDTFVLDASVTPIDDGFQAKVNFDIASGPVAPCKVIDSP